MIGQTRDDAAGEAFDKVSKMMGLGFPWGAKIARLAQGYRDSWLVIRDLWKRLFPTVLLEKDSLDFSFSGIKTAVKREVDKELAKNGILSEQFMQYIAYEFEEIVTDILAEKLLRALRQTQSSIMLLAWGVSANSRLKEKLESIALREGIRLLAPKRILYSMDNAAMVWIRAYYQVRNTR